MPSYGFDDTLRGLGAWSSGDRQGAGATEEGPTFSTLFSPVDPYNRWPVLVPFVSVAGAVAIVLLTGVAAASLVVMSFALMAVVFLLTQVFGYELAIPQMPR